MSDILHLTTANFDEVLDSTSSPLLVDLWASWCAPCRMIAPLLEDLAVEYDGRLQIAKLDVDAEPALAQKFSVRSIPTLAFIHDSEVVETIVGAVPRVQLQETTQRVLETIATAPTR